MSEVYYGAMLVYLGVKVFLWARQVRSENTKVQHVPLVEKQAVNIFFKTKHGLVQVCHSVLSFPYLIFVCFFTRAKFTPKNANFSR